MGTVKLAVAIPSARDWKVAFGASLVGLVRHLTLSGVPFDINIMQGASVLPRARQLAVDWARSINATHLLCLDDDMLFHATTVDKMLAHDVDIVACNYLGKATRKPLTHGLDGDVVESTGETGLQEVGWVGFGIVLIKLECLNGIPYPLFQTEWLEEKRDFIGEDFYFCRKVREHGVKIYCDHDASQTVGHIGDNVFGFAQKPRLVEAAE